MKIRYRDQLGDLLKSMNLPLIICELGVAEGLFAKTIMDWGAELLYLVDKWETIEGQSGDGGFTQEWHDTNVLQVIDRMAMYDNRPQKYIMLRGDTSTMADQIPDSSLSMVYVDADHSYEGVTKDLIAYYPKVISGGLIAMHDYLSPDYQVEKACRDFLKEKGYDYSEIVLIPENDIMDTGAYFIKH